MTQEMTVVPAYEGEAKALTAHAVGMVYTDKAGAEWQQIGVCAGPKLDIPWWDEDGNRVFVDKHGDEVGEGDEGAVPGRRVKWLAPRKRFSMTDDEIERIFDDPKLAKRFRSTEKGITAKWLARFVQMEGKEIARTRRGDMRRSGCATKLFLPLAKLKQQTQYLLCPGCKQVAGFHGSPPKGTKAYKALG